MNNFKIKRAIMCTDLKSLYASCECVERNLDSMIAKLLVAASNRGGGVLFWQLIQS